MADRSGPLGPQSPKACRNERRTILELLPSHVELLTRHQQRLGELARIGVDQGIEPAELAFIVADACGWFGATSLLVGAGVEFLVADPLGSVMVIPLDLGGLSAMLANVIREGADYVAVASRPFDSAPVLVVDGADEPALAFVAIEALFPERS